LTPRLNDCNFKEIRGHSLDHLMMLIYPTAVLGIAQEWDLSYGALIGLAVGGFIAFGAGAIPAGWLGDRWSRRGTMALFFFGIGAAGILTGFSQSPWHIAVGLTLVGLFAAIYHPVGIAMLVAGETTKLGRTLGINGVWGNLGLAAAALITGFLTDYVGWRFAFFIPGVVCILTGIAFLVFVPREAKPMKKAKRETPALPRAVIVRVFVVLLIATAAGGLIFNAAVIVMPKMFDDRIRDIVGSASGIGTIVAIIYTMAAFAQLCVGYLIDRHSLRNVFIPVALMQIPMLLLAAWTDGYVLLVVSFAMMFFVFGQIPINDAMVARYVDDHWRARVYAVRYVISLGVSATAVPLIALTYGTDGGFANLFIVLAAFAVLTSLATLYFPSTRRLTVPAAAE